MEQKRERGCMDIVLAGRRLTMCYSLNSLCDLEERAGMPLDWLMRRSFSATRLLLWAGLHRFQPGLTVWETGELIGECLQCGDSLEDILALCARGLRDAGLIGEGE